MLKYIIITISLFAVFNISTKEPTVEVILTQNQLQEIECIADNIYFESAGESTSGKYAVANVVMNRLNHPKFPKHACKVIQERKNKTCQFSWWCEKSKRKISLDKKMAVFGKEYKNCYDIAFDVYVNKTYDNTHGALFYHATYVTPNWKYSKTVQIGNHIFYKLN